MIFAAPAVLLILQIHWVLFSRSACIEMFVAEKITRGEYMVCRDFLFFLSFSRREFREIYFR